ncbi:anhydro-N-acetylmuramic acid kinase [Arthrobacter sp. NPDC058127]|uniref:anhydro-N-acetylmuramic acid kinase n=1 Tax=Arthrobacter sp. NPDC058127 TaxID=3346351 RepID=UPI0036E18705
MRVIGMMSGTSYDAIDAVAVDIERHGDELRVILLGSISESYSEDLRADLESQMPPAATSMEKVCKLDTHIGQEFARVASRANRDICDGRAALIASHGQTMFHWVQDRQVLGTLQLGEPAWIAETTGCTVVSGFRTRDVAAGGQGAPLVSIFDTLWLRHLPGRPVALNLGGIANITVASGEPSAFDTGPANALIDAAVTALTGGAQSYDRDGELGARGTVNTALLKQLLTEDYYRLPAPKTTGKELFHLPHLTAAMDSSGTSNLGIEDIVATLVTLTARTVAEAVANVGGTAVVASGGGTRNPTLMKVLAQELRGAGGGAELLTSDDLGLPSTAKEALAFAVLGYLTLNSIPGTVPSCTGARHPSILGNITPGANGLQLPERTVSAPASLRIM